MLALLVLVTPTTADRISLATSTYLCTGYADCQAAGYGHAGYRQASSTAYWRMFAGHNCTNYVAYRLIQSGMPDVRPWEGSGNASNWGVAMASITDQTPTVGSIAWYRPHVTPAGGNGHVAYVEQVISDTEIIVSVSEMTCSTYATWPFEPAGETFDLYQATDPTVGVWSVMLAIAAPQFEALPLPSQGRTSGIPDWISR